MSVSCYDLNFRKSSKEFKISFQSICRISVADFQAICRLPEVFQAIYRLPE